MKIAIIGTNGRLGATLAREYARDFDVTSFERRQLDLGRLDDIRSVLAQAGFELLINCAALTNVDYCESHRKEAFLVNSEAPHLLAEIANEKSAKLVHLHHSQRDEYYPGVSDAGNPLWLPFQLRMISLGLRRGSRIQRPARSYTLAELRLRWEWDSLRNNPRFQKILAGPEPKTTYGVNKSWMVGLLSYCRCAGALCAGAQAQAALTQLQELPLVPDGLAFGELKLHPKCDDLRNEPLFDKLLAAVAEPASIE